MLSEFTQLVSSAIPTITIHAPNIRAKKLLVYVLKQLLEERRETNGRFLNHQEVDELVLGLSLDVNAISDTIDTPEFNLFINELAELLYQTVLVHITAFPRASTKSIIDTLIKESSFNFE